MRARIEKALEPFVKARLAELERELAVERVRGIFSKRKRVALKTCSVLFALLLLFSSAQLVASSLETDYPKYVVEKEGPEIESEPGYTILLGEVVDSETGALLSGASVRGQVFSEQLEGKFRCSTDEKGSFRSVLRDLNAGEHRFVLRGSAVWYDPQIVVGTISQGEARHVRLELDYNPFDLELSPTSGSLTRAWAHYGWYKGSYTNTIPLPLKKVYADPIFLTTSKFDTFSAFSQNPLIMFNFI